MPALAGILKAPFDEQVAFFRAKLGNLVPTRTWRDVWKDQHDRAFMVAGAMKADLLADLAGAVEGAIADGQSIGWFRNQFDAIVERHGWAYRGEHDWRTRVIYQTNLATSYSAGRLAQLRAGGFPYWLYKHSDSVLHPRPLHVSWDGLVLPAGDPWWRTHYPPNGWGCQCRVVGVRDARAAKRLGGRMAPEGPDDGLVPGTDRPAGIDEGWDYMPGATSDLVRQIEAKLPSLPAPLAKNLKKELDNSSNGAKMESHGAASSQAPATGKEPKMTYKISNIDETLEQIVKSARISDRIDTNLARASLERGLVVGDEITMPGDAGIARYMGETIEQIKDGKVVKTIPATDDARRRLLMVKALHDSNKPIIVGRM
jgi:hypothetical protein